MVFEFLLKCCTFIIIHTSLSINDDTYGFCPPTIVYAKGTCHASIAPLFLVDTRSITITNW